MPQRDERIPLDDQQAAMSGRAGTFGGIAPNANG